MKQFHVVPPATGAARLAILLGGLCLALCQFAPPAAAESDPFPRPAALQPDVRFWIRIYSEIGTDGGLIHDSRNLSVIYETIKLADGLNTRARERQVSNTKKRIKSVLYRLAKGKRTNLSEEEQRVLGAFPPGVSDATLRASAGRLRFQLGQADKFRAGLVRSGAWEPHIRDTFRQMGLPAELAALPHVESSYTPHAYSRVGAAGLWQFTRSTGRRFMRVDHVVDERLDPFRATIAAARLLQQNRRVTGTWPLAITAYNHGASGMRRAVRKLGTRDIARIAREYKSRTFGFASRNFYVEFLAALEVDTHSEKYFGALLLDSPVEYATAELPFYTQANALARALGIDVATLRKSNPALLDSVWRGGKHAPRGFEIRVPRAQLARPLRTAFDDIPEASRLARQTRDSYHVVRRGETLSTIARRYHVRMSELVALNGLRSRNRIRAGQRLRLPDDSAGSRYASIRRTAPVTAADVPSNGRYSVQRGDTVAAIAQRFGLDESDLVAANGLRNRHRIYVGQSLLVARPAPPSSTKAKVAEQSAVDPHPHADPTLSPSRTASDSPQDLHPPSYAAADSEASDDASTGLVADPSDYSVAPDGTVQVQATETLGHYAEWLDVRASRLRQINGMSYGDPLVIGGDLRLDFTRVTPQTFEARRIEHHRELQEEFFARYEIAGTQVHVMRRGDSLWLLSQRRYRVPLWLLRQYNPDLDFRELHAGTRITIPQIRRHSGGTASSTVPEARPS